MKIINFRFEKKNVRFEEINWKDEEQLFNTILNSQKILQNKTNN